MCFSFVLNDNQEDGGPLRILTGISHSGHNLQVVSLHLCVNFRNHRCSAWMIRCSNLHFLLHLAASQEVLKCHSPAGVLETSNAKDARCVLFPTSVTIIDSFSLLPPLPAASSSRQPALPVHNFILLIPLSQPFLCIRSEPSDWSLLICIKEK